MTGDRRRCPEPEVLAAFVAGSLSGRELKMTADHLRDCEDCREVLADIAHVDRDYEPVAVSSPFRRRWPWWLAVAAAALTGICLVLWKALDRSASPIQILVAAAPRGERTLEPRLTGGFPWAPLRVQRTNEHPLDAQQMKLVGAAGTVLEKTAHDSSPEGRHAAAIANLVAGRPKEAGDLLNGLTANDSDPRFWSDLAAARYAQALRSDDPSQLAIALAAADAALQRAPQMPEARFNRALIVEHLGLREQALAAWHQYLQIDSASEWAREAKGHLASLAPKSEFRDELKRDYPHLQANVEAARSLARRFPQDARVWGETEILARWAEAVQAGDGAAAEAHLGVARAFGNELAHSSGERLLQAAVTGIERASAHDRRLLADAHLIFRNAQRTYGANKPGEAERMFSSAERAFTAAGSPVALLAGYFQANTVFDQNRNAEARERLETLFSLPHSDFPAFRAQVEWELGLVYAAAAQWGDSIRTLDTSITTFERLREYKHATAVREILAEVYDRIGDPHTAWKHRIVALRELGQLESLQLQVTLDSIAHSAAIEKEWPVAISFLGLELELARRAGDDFRVAQILTMRSRVEGQSDDRDRAVGDLTAAMNAIEHIDDAGMRSRAEADGLAAAGSLSTKPREAVALLSRAIDFHRSHGRRMFLPELLLRRGRARLALDDGSGAAADFEEGMAELEQERTAVPEGDERWGVFGTADELFDDAVGLALDRSQPERAFTYVERARARQLLESVGRTGPVGDAPALPNDVIVIEYASLPARLVIFVVDSKRVVAVQHRISSASLRSAVERLEQSIALRDEVAYRTVAADLYRAVVAPIAGALLQKRTLVFVPDATLRGVPFAALIDPRGHYLIEQAAVVAAPSTAVFVRLAAQPVPASRRVHLLVISGSSASRNDLDPLSAMQRETADVAAAYGELVAFAPKDASLAVFEHRAAAAEIVHFVGHTVTSDTGRDAALVVSRSAGPAGRLDARRIATMSLRHTRVVVLAACSSARGEERAGEGGISVARAFLAAGVPNVIATLWPIDDAAAADFFPRVHRHLAAGVAPAEALRAAQLECIQRREAPLGIWAAVQVLGSGTI